MTDDEFAADAAQRAIKRDRLAAVREGRPLVLTSHEAVSWYLDGIRTHVSLAGAPVVAVRVGDDGDALFVAVNEADRLGAEELCAADVTSIVRVPWQTSPAAAALGAGDAPLVESDVAAALRAARASLLPAETARYRALGSETAAVMTDVAVGLGPRSTERAAAAALAGGLVARGIDPLVILVAGAERLAHRHPLPTDAPLGDRAMLVVCGRRHGLIANATRWVGAEDVADARILDVEAAFLAATRPGARLDEIFAAGCAGYAAAGFEPDEWRRHHQGGPTGYAGRDPRATGAERDVVAENHAFAWNPSAPGQRFGVKVEDTILVASTGLEVLTVDPRWPTVLVEGVARPLVRPYS